MEIQMIKPMKIQIEIPTDNQWKTDKDTNRNNKANTIEIQMEIIVKILKKIPLKFDRNTYIDF